MTVHYSTPQAWAQGADAAYEALSAAIVAVTPVPLEGRVVLDLGAGTGATSRAICAVGGQPIELDLSHPMLAFSGASRRHRVVGDITALPIRTNALDGAVSAFSLSHVDTPGDVLEECRRVVKAGGPVLAGVFAATGPRHPATPLIEGLAARWGWSPPPWYLRMKDVLEPQVAADGALAAFAREAGLVSVAVSDVLVDAGLDTAEALVGWRLGVPSLAPWVAALPPAKRGELVRTAIDAVGSDPQPLVFVVRILSSIVPADR